VSSPAAGVCSKLLISPQILRSKMNRQLISRPDFRMTAPAAAMGE
jgi:hypothetical protein